MMPTDAPMTTAAPTLAEAVAFVYREVRLLDERRFDDWMALYTEDGTYWAPTEHDQASPDDAVSLFFDDRGTMAARVRRFAHPDIHVQTPLSRTTHVVSNIEVDSADPTTGEPIVHAAFVMAEHRGGDSRWYAGRYQYRLRRDGGAWRIARKTVRLVNCDDAFTAMAAYL